MKNEKRKMRKKKIMKNEKWKAKNNEKQKKKDLVIISVIECVNDWYYQMIEWRSVWAKKWVKDLVFWGKCFRFQINKIRDFKRNVWDFEQDGWCFDVTVLDFVSNFSVL